MVRRPPFVTLFVITLLLHASLNAWCLTDCEYLRIVPDLTVTAAPDESSCHESETTPGEDDTDNCERAHVEDTSIAAKQQFDSGATALLETVEILTSSVIADSSTIDALPDAGIHEPPPLFTLRI